ncbi:MAG: non-ribosomal peptide synthetase [Planctomycetota bacterium]|nr:MAG: non-ribosomal peptide synthetase [Planctomycetota bacterium]
MNGPTEMPPSEYDPFAGAPISKLAPTTEEQREILAAAALSDNANCAYNEAVVISLLGSVDPERLERALQQVVARHDALRTTFSADLDKQCINDLAAIALERIEVSGETGELRREAMQQWQTTLMQTPMSLSHGPLFRAFWIDIDADHAQLLLLAHHAVCDGWSFHVILEELQKFYEREDESILPAAPSFADYAEERQASETVSDSASWWRATLGDPPPAPLELPTDRARNATRSFQAGFTSHRFDAKQLSRIEALASQTRSSTVSVLIAGVATLLYRLTEHSDLTIGMPVARQGIENRPQLVGHCVQLLPLRLSIDSTAPFSHLVTDARSAILDATEHYDFGFGELVRDLGLSGDPARVPLVPVVVNVDQALEEVRIGNAVGTVRAVPRAADAFELFLNVAPDSDGMTIEATFQHALFDRAIIDAWLQGLEQLLLAAAEHPTDAIAALRLCPEPAPNEKERAGHAAEKPLGTWLTGLLAHASETPDKIAVEGNGEQLSYRELLSRARGLAAELLRVGIQPGDIVGVATPRSPQLLVSITAIHLAGAAHLPLDPSFPPSRLRFMLEDSRTVAIVDGDELSEEALTEGIVCIASSATATPVELPEIAAEQVAFLIYTSGSTGTPKGVRIPHRALDNLLRSIGKRPGLRPDDALLAITTISFDISMHELLGPLVNGARLVVATSVEAEDPAALDRLLREHEITVLQSTPATWRMLLDFGWTGNSSLRALCTGERLPESLAADLLPRVASLWNLYGPTETTIWSTVAEVSEAETAARVGTPIDQTQILILDKAGNSLPAGFPGEICISGAGLALGYHNRAQLTAERFVDHLVHGRYYRTGDLGRLRPDGSLEYLGRSDDQVKLRGYRIELGEIESMLLSHPDVAEAAVVVAGDQAQGQRLVAHIAASKDLSSDEIIQHLKVSLPRYMLPHEVVQRDRLPRLPNGKLDRNTLRSASSTPVVDLNAGGDAAALSDEAQLVAELMGKLLGTGPLGANVDFFAAGGHSLLAARLVTELNRAMNSSLTMRSVFESPTPQALSLTLHEASSNKVASIPVERRPEQARAPVTKLQDRIWYMQQMLKGQPHYNQPSGHRLRGPFDLEAMQRALREVVQRQAALRTVFERVAGVLEMVVHPSASGELLSLEDLSSLPEPARSVTLNQKLKDAIARPFDLAQGPLFVAKLYRLAADEHLLFFMPHHIIWDGWSLDVFYQEMAAIYAAYSEGREHQLPALPYSYGDFTSWHCKVQASPELRAESAAWRSRLEDFGAVSPLPMDQDRTSAMSGSGSTEWISIGPEQTKALHEFASANSCTMFHVLLAAYTTLLYDYSSYQRLLIATPLRGREAPGSESLMGCCNSLLPLPFTIAADDSFLDLLQQVRETATAGLDHSNVMLEDVALREDQQKTTLYHALFSFQDTRERVRRWGKLHHEAVHLSQDGATEDLGLWFMEGIDGLLGGLTFNSDTFHMSTIEWLRNGMLEVLTNAVQDPSRLLASLCSTAPQASAARPSPNNAPQAKPSDSELRDLPKAAGHSAYLLAAIWKRLLKVPSVDLLDNFFELGGDSLLAIRSISEFEEATGTLIDLGAFLGNPTIAGVSEHIAAGAKKKSSAVVPLQHLGDGAPVYCLLGVGVYLHFAASLGEEQPVFGVYTAEENVLSDKLDTLQSSAIDRLAKAYVDILQREIPGRRLQLAGLSLGGIIAMEVARLMSEQGYIVERVVLFDTILPNGYRKKWWKYLCKAPLALLRQLRTRKAADKAVATRDSEKQGIFLDMISQELPKWARSYRAPQLPVYLCRATDENNWGSNSLHFEHDYGWKALIGDHLEIVLTEGDHTSLLRPPNIEALTNNLRTRIASSEPR